MLLPVWYRSVETARRLRLGRRCAHPHHAVVQRCPLVVCSVSSGWRGGEQHHPLLPAPCPAVKGSHRLTCFKPAWFHSRLGTRGFVTWFGSRKCEAGFVVLQSCSCCFDEQSPLQAVALGQVHLLLSQRDVPGPRNCPAQWWSQPVTG